MLTQTTPCQSKSTQKTKAVDSISFADESFDEDNPCDVPVPTGLDHFKGLQNCCVDATASGEQFDMSRPCAACGKPGHTFNDCLVLNNVDFPHKHHIGFQSFLKQNAAETSPAQVNALQTDSANIKSPVGSIAGNLEEDFCWGQEWQLTPKSIPAAQMGLSPSLQQCPQH